MKPTTPETTSTTTSNATKVAFLGFYVLSFFENFICKALLAAKPFEMDQQSKRTSRADDKVSGKQKWMER
jgi:hypothetical protein